MLISMNYDDEVPQKLLSANYDDEVPKKLLSSRNVLPGGLSSVGHWLWRVDVRIWLRNSEN